MIRERERVATFSEPNKIGGIKNQKKKKKQGFVF